MSQAPSMPVFPDALIADTTDLSMEEFGAYCMILMVTWRNNGKPLPDDQARMARTCRMTEKRWMERVRPTLIRFFDLSGGTWRQHRLEKEWNFIAKHRANQSEKGKKGGRPKPLKNNDSEKAAAFPRFKPDESPQSQSHKDTLQANACRESIKPIPSGQDPANDLPQSQDPENFGEWWQNVPRRVSRGQAVRAYRAALKHASPAELLAGIRRYAEQVAGKDPQYIAHPATWLNGKRWLDEPMQTSGGGRNADRQPEQYRPATRTYAADDDARRRAILDVMGPDVVSSRAAAGRSG